MSKYETAMMEIVKPVIDYLREISPKNYISKISSNNKNNDITTTVTVKETENGKDDTDICSITNSAIYGLNFKSNNCRLLSYNKLTELVKSVGIDEDMLFCLNISDRLPNHDIFKNSH
jgi:hypothetical protein